MARLFDDADYVENSTTPPVTFTVSAWVRPDSLDLAFFWGEQGSHHWAMRVEGAGDPLRVRNPNAEDAGDAGDV